MENSKIINRMEKLLAKRKKTPKNLIDFLGISKDAFEDWKSGKSNTYQEHVLKIADFLNVPVFFLLGKGIVACDRLQKARIRANKSIQQIAEMVKVDLDTYVKWENSDTLIDADLVLCLSNSLEIDLLYIMGAEYTLNPNINAWDSDVWTDCGKVRDPETREVLSVKHGNPTYDLDSIVQKIQSLEKESPADEGEASETVVIYHRDGKTVRRELTPEQMKMLASMIDAIPEEPKGI